MHLRWTVPAISKGRNSVSAVSGGGTYASRFHQILVAGARIEPRCATITVHGTTGEWKGLRRRGRDRGRHDGYRGRAPGALGVARPDDALPAGRRHQRHGLRAWAGDRGGTAERRGP